MSSLDNNEEDQAPDVEICNHLCKEFMEITNSDAAMAHFFLQEAGWNLESAIDRYFSSKNNAEAQDTSSSSEHSESDPISSDHSPDLPEKESAAASSDVMEKPKTDEGDQKKVLKLMTWNIDGLDQNGIAIRTKAVCTIVLKIKPTVVFLQEVVNDSLKILADYLSDEYWVLKGKEPRVSVAPGYFVAILMKRSDVQLDREPELIPFTDSNMGRALLKIEVDILGSPCILMTSHLESTKDCAGERLKQLQTCFEILDKKVPDNVTAFFGGDLNLRDKEVDQAGGLPAGVQDLWVALGSQKPFQYTWDCMKNDNLNAFEDAKFKPRSRFDRLYIKQAVVGGPVWKPIDFALAGTDRIKQYNRFPSDHWAIMCTLEKI